jgi:hypothetical protein
MQRKKQDAKKPQRLTRDTIGGTKSKGKTVLDPTSKSGKIQTGTKINFPPLK